MSKVIITIILAMFNPTGPREIEPPPVEPEPGVYLCCEPAGGEAWHIPCDYVPPSECEGILLYCPWGAEPYGTGWGSGYYCSDSLPV